MQIQAAEEGGVQGGQDLQVQLAAANDLGPREFQMFKRKGKVSCNNFVDY